MFEKILVPLDGSENSEQALPVAEYLAGKLKSEVTLFTALEPVNGFERPFRIYLDKMVSDFSTDRVRSELVTTPGGGAAAILQYLAENKYDLIVLCTHGKTGPGLWAIGSVAAKVIQQARIPVLLLRSGSSEQTTVEQIFQSILVPLDGSSLAESVIPYVQHLASKLGSQAYPIRVIDTLKFPPVPVLNYASGAALKDYEKDLAEMMTREALQYINEKGIALEGQGISATAVLLAGKPCQLIPQYATDTGIGLIAMTTHGFTGSQKVPYGSITSRVLESSSQPVLLVRPEELT